MALFSAFQVIPGRMTTRAERIGRKRPRRTHGAPPPPARDWWPILEELPDELGVEIAMIVRRIWLAKDSPQHSGGTRLFSSGSQFVVERQAEAVTQMGPDTRHEFRALMAAVYAAREASGAEEAAEAVEALVDWAQRGGYVQTALHLAEAGAALAPTSPRAIFIAGRTNRQIGDAWRAEAFYRAAILDAYRQQRWKDYICAQLGLGTLLIDKGQLSSASIRYLRAARAAADQGIEWLAAQTFHDVASLHFQRGDVRAAIQSVTEALQLYPVMNERLPVAVHDLAFLCVVEQHYVEAMSLLELLIPLPLLPQDQVLVSGTFARTAGGLGEHAQYLKAEARVQHFAEAHKQHADASYVNLAYGARSLGWWSRAAEHAARGARLAGDAEHAFVERVAWELLTEITARTPGPPAAPPLKGERAAQLSELTDSLRKQLGGWRWNPDQSGPGKLDPTQC